jgi:hypothetical protein
MSAALVIGIIALVISVFNLLASIGLAGETGDSLEVGAGWLGSLEGRVEALEDVVSDAPGALVGSVGSCGNPTCTLCNPIPLTDDTEGGTVGPDFL